MRYQLGQDCSVVTRPFSLEMASHSGAAEHTARGTQSVAFGGRGSYGMSDHPGTSSGSLRRGAWEGTLAFSNIGLAGEAVRGKNWSKKHRPRLTRLVTELFQANDSQGRRLELLGILFE